MASFGENLRRERELRGVSLREIADASKISLRFLEALEQDRVEVLPGGIFRRAFVREYARHVGLDADRVVAEFVYAHGSDAAEAPPPERAAAGPNRGTLIVAGCLVLLVPLLVAKAAHQRSQAAPPQAPRNVSTRFEPTPAPPAAESAVHDGIELRLSARENCWVQVSADGQSVLNRVLARGESQTIQARGEIVLSVGNAGGLDFSVDDRRGVSLGRSGEVRRNIVITRESLPSLVEDAAAPPDSHSS